MLWRLPLREQFLLKSRQWREESAESQVLVTMETRQARNVVQIKSLFAHHYVWFLKAQNILRVTKKNMFRQLIHFMLHHSQFSSLVLQQSQEAMDLDWFCIILFLKLLSIVMIFWMCMIILKFSHIWNEADIFFLLNKWCDHEKYCICAFAWIFWTFQFILLLGLLYNKLEGLLNGSPVAILIQGRMGPNPIMVSLGQSGSPAVVTQQVLYRVSWNLQNPDYQMTKWRKLFSTTYWKSNFIKNICTCYWKWWHYIWSFVW